MYANRRYSITYLPSYFGNTAEEFKVIREGLNSCSFSICQRAWFWIVITPCSTTASCDNRF